MDKKNNMGYNFNMIIPRLVDSFDHLDIEKANYILKNIKGNCICIGTGGSNSVSLYASIILDAANHIIAISKEPRDILYMNLFNRYDYLLAITYGNNNYGITEAMQEARDSKLFHHAITTNSVSDDDICYKGTIPNEKSFISLASTIIPMSIMLNYYLGYDKKEVLGLIKEMYLNAKRISTNFNFNTDFPLFEIMSGDDTYVASKVLESTIVEAGLGIPVVHEKYSFCHGRSSLSYTQGNSNLIYLVNGECTNLDNELLSNIKGLYNNIIFVNSESEDQIIGEFDLVLKSLMLCGVIAKKQEKDLSKVQYAGVVKKLYKYNGGM